jgi:folate-dependent phosphoribosylglycinamide formyltransferase PurN
MTGRARVGLLTMRHHPTLPALLDRFGAATEIEPVLIFDEKDFSEKDAGIFQDRTGGAFPLRAPETFVPRYRAITVPNHNGHECLAFVRDATLGLLVNAGTPRRIGRPLIESTPGGVLNVHPGILPKYRGATCCEWAIYHDDPVGVTAHFMDEGLDSGPIIFDRVLKVSPGESYRDVRVALYGLALDTVVEAVRLIVGHGLTASALPPQPAADVFKPMPARLLAEVQRKLAAGEYACPR